MLKKSFIKLLKIGLKLVVIKSFKNRASDSEIFSDKNINFFCKKFEEYWLSNCPDVEYKKILFDKKVFIWIKTNSAINFYVSDDNFNKMIFDYILKNKTNRDRNIFKLNFYNTYIHKSLSLTLKFYENYYDDPGFMNRYNLCLYSFSSGFKKFITKEKSISKYNFIPLSYL